MYDDRCQARRCQQLADIKLHGIWFCVKHGHKVFKRFHELSDDYGKFAFRRAVLELTPAHLKGEVK